jgi:hypothetical protein
MFFETILLFSDNLQTLEDDLQSGLVFENVVPKRLGEFQSKVLNNQLIISIKRFNKICFKINVTYSENKSLVDCTKNYVRIVREIVW